MKTLSEFLAEKSRAKLATGRGTDIHRQLQFLQLDDGSKIAQKIRENPQLAQFWAPRSRAEVPIAGRIDGKFYSKRIDRLVIVDESELFPRGEGGMHKKAGQVLFLDYKTDAARARRPEYERTMQIYAALLRAAHPDCEVGGFILWLHDWELEQIIAEAGR
jgi:hypothetical protein